MPSLNVDINGLLRMPFGEAAQGTIFTLYRDITDVLSNSLVANSVQLFVTILYFFLNALLSSMMLAREWDSYGFRAKGLRVSGIPVCGQRETYRLSIPLRYSLPLLVVSGLLHWLVSQSIFLVAIEIYSWQWSDGPSWQRSGALSMRCSYSPPAIVCAAIVLFCLMVCVIALGAKKFKSDIPLVGSCSAAISAACHPGSLHDTSTAWNPVQWGEIMDGRRNGPRHCAFSCNDVTAPREGEQYR